MTAASAASAPGPSEMAAPETAAKPAAGTDPARTSSGIVSTELGKRIASAIVLIPLALLAAYLGGWPFALFWLAAGIAAAVEWTAMARVGPLRPVQAVARQKGMRLAAIDEVVELVDAQLAKNRQAKAA